MARSQNQGGGEMITKLNEISEKAYKKGFMDGSKATLKEVLGLKLVNSFVVYNKLYKKGWNDCLKAVAKLKEVSK